MNHSLLCSLGVSHPSLNSITILTDSLYHDLKCSTKLTGAGGGGCAFTFLEDDEETDKGEHDSNDNVNSRAKIVSNKIETLKGPCIDGGQKDWTFECFTSAVGGKGVLWLCSESNY